MRLVNLTPHEIVIHGSTRGGETRASISPEPISARVESALVPAGTVIGLALVRQVYGETVGIPAPVEGVMLVVSAVVRAANPARTDLASPGELIRNSAGQPVGCRGLVIS